MSRKTDNLHESIQLGAVEVAAIGKHSPPLDEYNHRTWGSVEDLLVRIILRQQAYLRVLSHARSDLWHEVGGALVGSVYQFNGQTYVEIDGALSARMTRSSATHLTFSAETWVEIQDDLGRYYPGSRIVGWYHTHPGIGVFFSGDDLFIHKHFFKELWQLALVVDPIAWQARFFIWRDQRIVQASGCYEMFDVADRISLVESLVPVTPLPETRPEEKGEEEEKEEEEAVPQHPLLVFAFNIWRLLLRMVRRLVGDLGEKDETSLEGREEDEASSEMPEEKEGSLEGQEEDETSSEMPEENEESLEGGEEAEGSLEGREGICAEGTDGRFSEDRGE